MPSPISRKPKFKSPEDFVQSLEDISHSNAYLKSTFNRESLIQKLSQTNEGELGGYIYSIKDSISNTDGIVTGGSKFLWDYRPPFNSSVYKAVNSAGAVNIVHSNLDEFGLGGSGLFSFAGVVPNAVDPERIIGGSSSGSVYLIKKGFVDFALVSDTGDSARYPASLVGVVGFKPSYGLVSRYGFFPFCSSFDTPAICSDSVETIARVLSVISFPDSRDLCTLKTQKKNYFKCLSDPLNRTIKVAILEDTFWSKNPITSDSYLGVKDKFHKFMNELSNDVNIEIGSYSFSNPNLLRLCELIYDVVAYSESISNYSNLTGLLFPFKTEGNKTTSINVDNGNNYHEIVLNNRADLGEEFMVRQILGKHFLEGDNYEGIYLQSKKIINLINREMSKLFESYDVVISPTNFDIPSKIDSWKRNYSPRGDTNIRLLANFCALPAISIP